MSAASSSSDGWGSGGGGGKTYRIRSKGVLPKQQLCHYCNLIIEPDEYQPVHIAIPPPKHSVTLYWHYNCSRVAYDVPNSSVKKKGMLGVDNG